MLRLSYRDYLVADAVWRAYSDFFFPEREEQFLENKMDQSPSILLLQRISVRQWDPGIITDITVNSGQLVVPY